MNTHEITKQAMGENLEKSVSHPELVNIKYNNIKAIINRILYNLDSVIW